MHFLFQKTLSFEVKQTVKTSTGTLSQGKSFSQGSDGSNEELSI